MSENNIFSVLIDVLGISSSFQTQTEKIAQLLPESDKEKLLEMLSGCKDDMLKIYAKAYSELFSVEEAKKLIELHQHPTMKKLIENKETLIRKVEVHAKTMALEQFISKNISKQQVESLNTPISDPNKKLN